MHPSWMSPLAQKVRHLLLILISIESSIANRLSIVLFDRDRPMTKIKLSIFVEARDLLRRVLCQILLFWPECIILIYSLFILNTDQLQQKIADCMFFIEMKGQELEKLWFSQKEKILVKKKRKCLVLSLACCVNLTVEGSFWIFCQPYLRFSCNLNDNL